MKVDSPAKRNARLRLRVTAAAESKLRAGHPWLFADSILEQNREGELGELGIIYDRKDRFLAAGLFDPESPLRVRVLHAGKPQTLDDAWWRANLERALAKRSGLFDERTSGFRCINGESDGWPGLVLDRYGKTFVVKLYSAAWLPKLEESVRLFTKRLGFERLVLRLSRNIQPTASRYGKRDGTVLTGEPLSAPVVFEESGLKFEAEVLRGQKTGFFLDQRENRRRVETLSQGCRVLNAFSFSGGFSLYAARGGAVSVMDLDLSAHALESSKRNFELNRSNAAVARCRHDLIQADAFEWLESSRAARFDMVILDPPSLAKRESERGGAIRAYRRLAESGIRQLEKGGVLVACSCSAHVSAEEFYRAVIQAASGSGAGFEELARSGHAADHLASFKEAEYLKALFLRIKTACSPRFPKR